MRLLKSHPILRLANYYLVDSQQPLNLSNMWNFGSLLAFCLIIQIFTGVTLAMHYNPNVAEAFNSVVKRVNDSCVIWQSKLRYLPKPHAFSSMPMQSGIFTINRNIIIGLVSSIITAAIGYGVRLILLNYLEYDVFTNLDNWIASLSYFCSLGGIRFVINECLKENTFLMYYCGGNMAVSNPTAGSGSLTVGISPMQAPNQPGIGSSTPEGSSGALITDDRSKLEQRILKVEQKLSYCREQFQGARLDLNEIESRRSVYIESGKAEEWEREYKNAEEAVKDCDTNLFSEMRMHRTLTTKLANGDYSMSVASATTKRGFTDSSMSNDDSTGPVNKRTSDNQ